ncbi:ABC transporter substrate-binding protein [Rhizobium sp. L1K21]|uniref:ABC transporter substrate-binding protein n=1 Tax=Rhizobium sp. L1K21 TaxID=2954933 RepID=UPI0020922B6C|nr:extracellular solute-binding protein [Rhizobium sp. L1K21]MCO6188534.1 extracellular solute-binding protein [Rhizobium sp. L1K21]
MSNRIYAGLSRRTLLGSAAYLGLAMAAGRAFSQAFGDGGGLPPADGSLRWLDSGGQKGVFIKEYLTKYGEARGIEVVYDGLPWKEIASVLPLGIRNGSAPDTFNLPIGMEPSVAISEGWLQPIDDLIPDFDNWKKAYPNGSFVEGINVFGGKTYGFPFSTERRFNNALLFNQDMMNEAGYDHINADRALTFDEMREAARKITENSGGRSFGFIIGGAQEPRWGNTATMLAQRGGATVGSSGLLEGMDLKTGEFAFDHDAYVAGVELLLAMNSDRSVFPGSLTIIAPQAREFITQGAAGMIIQGPWNIPIWEEKTPNFNFGVSPGPAPDEASLDNPVWVMQLPNSTNMMWLNAKANNAQYAGDFFHWLGSLEGQLAYANVASCADPAIFPETIKLAQLSERAVTMLQMAEKRVRIAPNPFVRNPELSKVAAAYVDPTPNLAQAVQGLFAGQLTDVKATLKKASDARNKALDEAIAKAKSDGANVSRDDFAFAAWEETRDFGPEDYAKQ